MRGEGRFDPDNTTPGGDYIVGKGRPPESGKFRKGDGRKRGRRAKGTRNLATDLRDELEGIVSVTVGGVTKRATRQQATIMRLIDSAMKGQTPAMALLFDLEQRLVAPGRRREEQQKQTNRRTDYSRLSRNELRALEYLHAKAHGIELKLSRVPGMPIHSDPDCADS